LKITFGAGAPVTIAKPTESGSPVWNLELWLPFLFPTFGDVLRIQIFNKRKLHEDDLIATVAIPFEEIKILNKKNQEGLGSRWYNLYGADKKEINIEIAKEMNAGRIEGSSYRGRLRLSLRTV